MYKMVEDLLTANPVKVELAINDYQDEGLKLDLFVLGENLSVEDSCELESGEHDFLKTKMLEVYDFLKKHNINVSYTLDVEMY